MAKYINSNELFNVFNSVPWESIKDKELAIDAVFEVESKKGMWVVPNRVRVGDRVMTCDGYFSGDDTVKENTVYLVEKVDRSVLEMGDDDYLIKLLGVDGYWYSEHFLKIVE